MLPPHKNDRGTRERKRKRCQVDTFRPADYRSKRIQWGTGDEDFGYWGRRTGTRAGLEAEAIRPRGEDLVRSGQRWNRRGGKLPGRRSRGCIGARNARGNNWARPDRGRAGAPTGE